MYFELADEVCCIAVDFLYCCNSNSLFCTQKEIAVAVEHQVQARTRFWNKVFSSREMDGSFTDRPVGDDITLKPPPSEAISLEERKHSSSKSIITVTDPVNNAKFLRASSTAAAEVASSRSQSRTSSTVEGERQQHHAGREHFTRGGTRTNSLSSASISSHQNSNHGAPSTGNNPGDSNTAAGQQGSIDLILQQQQPPRRTSDVNRFKTNSDTSSMFVNVKSRDPETTPACNCRKSRCLKLYCECFTQGVYCYGCNCVSCCNIESAEPSRAEAVETVLLKRPDAFSKVKAAKVRVLCLERCGSDTMCCPRLL
jgi:hypothetical protein